MGRKLRQILHRAPSSVLDEMANEQWSVDLTRSGHVKWTHPNGSIVIASSSPSDHRSWANHLARMRRARQRTA